MQEISSRSVSTRSSQLRPTSCNPKSNTGCYDFQCFAGLFNIGAVDLLANPPVLNLRNVSYFNNEIQDGNRSVYQVRGDGNCMFRAISKFFFGHENFHGQVRTQIVLYMANHPEELESYIFSDELDFVEYLNNMSSSTSCSIEAWGGSAELYALATMLQRKVYVYSDFGGDLQWSEFSPLFEEEGINAEAVCPVPYVTLIHHGNHYDLVKPTLQFCTCNLPEPVLRGHETVEPIDISSDSDYSDPKGKHGNLPDGKKDQGNIDMANDNTDTLIQNGRAGECNLPEEKGKDDTQNMHTVKKQNTRGKGRKRKMSHDDNCYSNSPLKGKHGKSKCDKNDQLFDRSLQHQKEKHTTLNHTSFDKCNQSRGEGNLPEGKTQGKIKESNENISSGRKRTCKKGKGSKRKVSHDNNGYECENNPQQKEKKNGQLLDHSMEHKTKKPTDFSHDGKVMKTSFPLPNDFGKFHKECFIGPTLVCFSCKKTFYPSDSIKLIDLKGKKETSLLQFLGSLLQQEKMCTSMEVCNIEKTQKLRLCSVCYKNMIQTKVPAQCYFNDLYVPRVPPELICLNFIEKRLICLVHAYMKLAILPYGQSSLCGQMINFPYNIEEMVNKPTRDDGFVIISLDSSGTLPKEFVADMQKVKVALNWLKINNLLYKNCSVPPPTKPIILHAPSDGNNHDQSTITSGPNDDVDFIESSVVLDDPVIPLLDFQKLVTAKNTSQTVTKTQNMSKKKNISGSEPPKHSLPLNTANPVNMFNDTVLEQAAFPYLFPDGKNGFKTPRQVPLTHLQYFKSRLMSIDRRFSSHLPYLFWATNVVEKKYLSDSISVAIKMRPSKSGKRSLGLNAGGVRSEVKNNPDFPDNYFGFMRNIRGSAAYWNKAKLDVLAMIQNLGPPTWFLTLSANDMNWFDLMKVLCEQEGLPCEYPDIVKMSKQHKVSLMNKNPILTARHFSHRLHHFVYKVILSDKEPIGRVKNYFWRIEFKMRGSPHVHSLWWIENAPNIETDTGRKELPDFLDKYVSACVPVNGPLQSQVLALQTHKHTGTCRKYLKGNQNAHCRFDFPQPLSVKTVVKSVQDLSKTPKCYNLKRLPGCEFINPYNPTLLQHWNANMDIQFVGSVYGAAAYVCSYICKKEADKLKDILRGVKEKLPEAASMRQKLSSIGNVFLTHRQLSAQEAAFKMCALPLRSASSKVQYVDTRPRDYRTRLLLPNSVLNNLKDDSTEIFHNNVHDYYVHRPHIELFEEMPFFDFASWYCVSKKKGKDTGDEVKFFKLENDLGYLRKRQKPCILRTPKFSVEKDGDVYYTSFLLMHKPFRDEEDLFHGFDTAEHAFKDWILKHPQPNDVFAERLENAVNQIQTLSDEVVNNYIAPVVAPNIEALDNDLNSIQTGPVPDQHSILDIGHTEVRDFDFESEIFTNQSKLISEAAQQMEIGLQEVAEIKSLTSLRMTDRQYSEMVHNLNSEQREVYDYIKHQVISPDNKPIYANIWGPGGTGKSYLIKVLHECICRNDGKVVICAPTGVAAFNIHGVTLHRAFNLPVQHGSVAKYRPLSGERLQQMRKFWHGVTTVIIDEISMVSYDTLVHLHLRLGEITSKIHNHFGGLNMIAFGDFFQLPPVHGNFIFCGERKAGSGDHIWRDLFHMFELKKVVRQKDDLEYLGLLNRIRTGEQSEMDIRFMIMKWQKTQSLDILRLDKSTLFLYPTLKQCEQHNSKMLMHVAKDEKIFCIKAKHEKLDTNSKGQLLIRPNSTRNALSYLIPKDDRECAGLQREFYVSVNAVVMLRRNINTPDGLVNGARGIVTGFEWDSQDTQMPKNILIQFFDENVGKLNCSANSSSVAIAPISAIFHGKRNSVLQRTQFPLTLSWGCTIHKVQGLTLDTAVVDLGSKVFADGMAYVALSRVKTSAGLHILDFSPKSIRVSDKVKEELCRMRQKRDGNGNSVKPEE